MKLCKEKLFSNLKNKWKIEILKKPKLRTYCTFKFELSLENYVNMILPQQERSILAQFRLGMLPLLLN